LSSYTVEIAELNQEFTKRLPRYPLLPATLLGRLAVDSRYQGQGFGELMLIDALNQSLKTTSVVASLAVVVEALDEELVKFYQRFGFQQFKQHPMKLYLPMKLIEKICKNRGS
jgi:predicted GNAT family N-acyltransferase